MVSRRNYLQGLMGLGVVGATGRVPRSTAAPTTFEEFVSTEGTTLTLGDDPYYFNGANAPWLTHTYPSRDTVDAVLDFASDLGLDVLRTGIHSVGVGGTVHSPEPGQLGEEAFRHVDYVVREAERHGIRLVFSLVDNWDYYGGMDAYVAASPTASDHDDFYTDDYCREWYRTYVRKVLTRQNTLTGRTYREDPTILMWELANEAEAKSAGLDVLHRWTADMAAHFSAIDDRHLVSTGSGGNYNTDSDIWLYSGGNGVDYVRNHMVPDVDVCSFHLYPEWAHENTNDFGKRWIREHLVDAHETIGKPAFLGEFGWAVGRTPSRATVYEDWLGVVDDEGGAGAAAWQLVNEDRSETSKHDIRPSDTGTTDVLASFADTQRTKRTGDGGGTDPRTTSSLAGERLDVTGAGGDIWGTADAFHYVHERVGGDATLVAQVTAQDDTDPWAKAGVMLRESLDAGAAHAMLVVTPDNGVAFQHRAETNGSTAHGGASGAVPQWVKIERRGDTVTGYTATDGEDWSAVGNATIPFDSPHVGFAVTSHDTGTPSTARFENVSGSAESVVAAWTNDDVGGVEYAGSVTRVGEPMAVETGTPTDVTDTEATVPVSITDLGGASSADVYVEYGPVSGSFTERTGTTTVTGTGPTDVTVGGLTPETEYAARAVAVAGDGDEAVGTARTFTTTASPPVVERFAATETAPDDGDAQIRAEWAVAEPDGDLASVAVEIADGGTVLSSTTSVGGSAAEGTDAFEIRDAAGRTFEVTLTVTNAAGVGTTRTERVDT